MIRLWHRVGLFRALAVLLLLAAVAGGVLLATDRQTQQDVSRAQLAASIERDEQRQLQLLAADHRRATAEDRAARSDAQRKANEAAAAAAAQAKAASSPQPSPSTSTKPPVRTAPPRSSLPVPASCNVYTGNRALGCALLLQAGFGLDQMPCLDRLWTKESGWNTYARNPSSGAYGIPQALPGWKMGPGWQNDPVVQIRWGLSYIKGRYNTPCGAWSYFQSHGWY